MVTVSFGDGAPDDEVTGIEQAFADLDIAADVSGQPYALVASGDGGNVDPFVVIATATASSFLAALGAKAARDGYDVVRTFISRARTARARDHGQVEIIIRSEDGGPDIYIGPHVPEGALGELISGDLPPFPSGSLVYDRGSRSWRDADEVERA